mmetsp:Transcript_47781/g.104032  ORF Transcript_47781/g.104032 Transcript_47781/m.104032 type:complete len:177 (-) Transcript_47781:153-683(-)|eukprot:CAMPEP_0170611830 /NCGR_PEP_ID=MMETSP0224-20130122/23399_1 /TAXON_ID=285029 /ORGANISM="Togula jolla, Strain CCCM 725" /LENGTH=176 /DNA_ID=CAMNT_0010937293 /DNA_START=40 /DNA_END=570 /DNA_ORIENTATION=+
MKGLLLLVSLVLSAQAALVTLRGITGQPVGNDVARNGSAANESASERNETVAELLRKVESFCGNLTAIVDSLPQDVVEQPQSPKALLKAMANQTCNFFEDVSASNSTEGQKLRELHGFLTDTKKEMLEKLQDMVKDLQGKAETQPAPNIIVAQLRSISRKEEARRSRSLLSWMQGL